MVCLVFVQNTMARNFILADNCELLLIPLFLCGPEWKKDLADIWKQTQVFT